ncbi:MAG: DUF362 domain-containing protein [bacterium]|jgi:uncharacterized protein (DUF362 family)|nr:DUF362 domain-containing protein [bacterium]
MPSRKPIYRRTFITSTSLGVLALCKGSHGADPLHRVGIRRCRRYRYEEIHEQLSQLFEQIGGIPDLVRGKTVSIKVNLTNVRPNPVYTLPAIETVYTHPLVVLASCTLFHAYGANRIIICESMTRNDETKAIYNACGYNTAVFESMVPILEWENTKNKGTGGKYHTLPVGENAYAFTSFDFNHRYVETDVMVSIAKMKNHDICGLTLSLKNMFGAPPNAIYAEPGKESTTSAKGALHSGDKNTQMPGVILPVLHPGEDGYRLPRIITDICRARPIDLALIDGITTMSGGEGEWNGKQLGLAIPNVLIAGRNPVCTDAVAAAVMGFDPQGAGWKKPFPNAENTLKMAADRGLGQNDLSQIEVLGLEIAQARYTFMHGKKRD